MNSSQSVNLVHEFPGLVRGIVEDWEIIEALSLTPMRKSGSVRMIQAYIRIKLLIGLRRGDLLRLRMSDITDAGIKVTPRKTASTTGTTRTYEWLELDVAAVHGAAAQGDEDRTAFHGARSTG